ncbi:MAG: hypothetical protein F2520_10840 [Actinobacteria bacterium]|nr:hypothetical protein [Actinomycetota bacterium]MTA78747.1 hypothetical protein [Actinomycetota bacterium]
MLYALSCVSATWCMAVGAYIGGGTANVLIMEWNGSSWTIDRSLESTAMVPSLTSVSCLTVSMCVAVGSHSIGAVRSLVVIWNGTTWSEVVDPSTSSTSMAAVSCVLPDACTIVGSHDDGSGGLPADRRSSVLTWDGQFWNEVSTASVGAVVNTLAAVSCTSMFACVAVGHRGVGTVDQTLALSLTSREPSVLLPGGIDEPVAPAYTG